MTYSGDSGSSNDDDEDNCTVIPGLTVSCIPLSRMEWKASKRFLIGVIPLFLIPLPLFVVYFFYYLTCQQFHHSSESQQSQLEQCTDLTWLIPYLFYLLQSLHSLVNPITSLWLNNDFQRPSPIKRLRMRMMSEL